MTIFHPMRRILRNAIRLYFAPLTGAYHGVAMSFRVFIGNNIKIEVNKMVHHFVTGLIQGMKETPRGYFAPAIAVWRLLLTTTDTLLQQKKLLSSDQHNPLNEISKR